jgi:hypothetical protein
LIGNKIFIKSGKKTPKCRKHALARGKNTQEKENKLINIKGDNKFWKRRCCKAP